jgi:hypothetical protein
MRTRVVAFGVALALVPVFALAGEVLFNVPADVEEELFVGEEFAYSLCLGRSVTVPGPGQRQVSLDAVQSPCGSSANPSPTVGGGNPPYYFVLDSGGFPPMGLFLDKNGVLRGTPRSTMASRFRVCAIDESANQSCRQITLQPKPARAHANASGHAAVSQGGTGGPDVALLGILGGAAAVGTGLVAANLGAANETTNTRKCSGGQTDCGDGHCCNAGDGCCGIHGGQEVCCSADYPHYCPSTNKCYRTMPSCDFVLCGGVISTAPGAVVGVGPVPGTLNPGNPSSTSEGGVPPSLACPTR